MNPTDIVVLHNDDNQLYLDDHSDIDDHDSHLSEGIEDTDMSFIMDITPMITVHMIYHLKVSMKKKMKLITFV
jgi:hypothetical protein